MLLSCVCAFALSVALGAVEIPLMADTFEDAAVGAFPDSPQVGTWTAGSAIVSDGVLDGHDLRFVDPGDGQAVNAYGTAPNVGAGVYRYDFEFVVLEEPVATGAFFNFVSSQDAMGAHDRFWLRRHPSTEEPQIAVSGDAYVVVGAWAVGERRSVRVEFNTATSLVRYFIDDMATPVEERTTTGERWEVGAFSTLADGDANVAIDNVSFVFVPGVGVWMLPVVAGVLGLRRGRGRA